MKQSVDDMTEDEREAIVAAAERVFPCVLPASWARVALYANGGCWANDSGVRVIAEVERQDGNLWIHMSVSRSDRLPDWADLRAAKNLFIGAEARAIQNLPPESEYFNLHPFCLHLYSPLDHSPIPDFRAADGAL